MEREAWNSTLSFFPWGATLQMVARCHVSIPSTVQKFKMTHTLHCAIQRVARRYLKRIKSSIERQKAIEEATAAAEAKKAKKET